MKCQACDEILCAREASRKSLITGEYFDLCDLCFETIKDVVFWTENENIKDEEDEE